MKKQEFSEAEKAVLFSMGMAILLDVVFLVRHRTGEFKMKMPLCDEV